MSFPKVTLREVAKEAGVSLATASRALGGYAPVNEEIKKRVFEAARKLHYQHNAVAKNLRTRRTFTIGYLLPDITNPFYAGIARGIQDVAGSRGYSVILCNNDNDPAKTERFGKMLLRHRVEGIIYSTPYNEALLEMVEMATANGIPVVNCYGSTRVPALDVVTGDAEEGCYRATRYLLELGHRRIAFLKVRESGISARRLEGCRRAFVEMKLEFPEDLVVEAGDYSQESGYLGTKILFTRPEIPTALFAFSEQLAIGALKAARESNLQIPERLSLVGIDDVIGAVLQPPLTSIHIPVYEAGKTAVMLLLERIEAQLPATPRRVVLTEKLVVRESTRSLMETSPERESGENS